MVMCKTWPVYSLQHKITGDPHIKLKESLGAYLVLRKSRGWFKEREVKM